MKTLTFTAENMAVLLEAHVAVNELNKLMYKINGGGGDAGIVRKLGRIESLLQDLSPVYNPGEDISEDSVFWSAVLGVQEETEKRVAVLMGEQG